MDKKDLLGKVMSNALFKQLADSIDDDQIRYAVGRFVPYVIKAQGPLMAGEWKDKLTYAREGSAEEFSKVVHEYVEALADATTELILADIKKEMEAIKAQEDNEHES